MTNLPWTMTGTLVDTREPHRRAEFVCYACCERARMTTNEVGYCIVQCERHPAIMIRAGKVVGTSA